jgi:hypothetical protein
MAKRSYPKPYKWAPTNPHKFVGDLNNIVIRSSWEAKFVKWADLNPDVIKVASEEIIIPYLSPVDNKMHRYFTDFAIVVRHRDGNLRKYLIEIKPDIQTQPPKKGKRTTNKYIADLATFAVNQAKWQAADIYCQKHGLTFQVLTEKHLFK